MSVEDFKKDMMDKYNGKVISSDTLIELCCDVLIRYAPVLMESGWVCKRCQAFNIKDPNYCYNCGEARG